MLRKDPDLDRRIAAVAAGAAVIFLLAALLFWATDTGAGTDAPEPDAAPTASERVAGSTADGMLAAARRLPVAEDCRVHVTAVVLTTDAGDAPGAAPGRLQTDTIRPAEPAGIGVHDLPVQSTVRVGCGLERGVIATDGGVRLSAGERQLELQRVRVDLATGSLAAFLGPDGRRSLIASQTAPETIRREVGPDGPRVVIPLAPTAGLVERVDEDLGLRLETGGEIGAVAITAATHAVED